MPVNNSIDRTSCDLQHFVYRPSTSTLFLDASKEANLAKVHSSAVDAPKTGKLPKMQGIGEIKAYPDFMMKRDKPSYPSDKVLGKLYRRCRKFQNAASEKYNQKMRVDKSFLQQGYDRYIEEANELYRQYRDKMQVLMSLYGIESEAEVFLKLRNHRSKEKTEIAKIVDSLLFKMRLEFRSIFSHQFNVNGQHLLENEDITDEMLLKASAWYTAAYTHAHDQRNDTDQSHQKRLLGFPWFVNDVIITGQSPDFSARRRRPNLHSNHRRSVSNNRQALLS